MLSYAHGVCEKPLLGETIGQNLDRVAARHPGAAALVSRRQDVRWSYAEFVAAVDRLATALCRRGLQKGDRLGVWGPNVAEWALAQYATAKLGVILVNVNPAYRTSELQYALAHSACRWLFAAKECRGADFRAMLEEVSGELPELERTFFFDTEEWAELASEQADRELLSERGSDLDFDDPINIQYTSGTTGAPKGATLSHLNILNNARWAAELLRYTPEDRVCIPVPLYHCFGMVLGNLACTCTGACIVYPAPVFEPEATLECCAA